MKALVLEDVARFEVRDIPSPALGAGDVLIRVGAVGLCGTDLHIFHGFANYHRDQNGQPIPLRQAPQILGHEFCGTVEVVGSDVRKCKPGDKVVADQVLNCHSKGRSPICEYCATGDSHQCAFGEELGITGLPGAFAELVSVPQNNVVLLPAKVSLTKGAVIEPLACVLHASDRMERSTLRYGFDGRYRIKNVLIMGAGPSGLLFLQYLRNIKRFEGQIFVTDLRESKLALAKKMGGTPLDVRTINLVSEIRKRTGGEMIHYLIEASGAGPVFDVVPVLLRHQASFLLYGAGHAGKDIGCLTHFQVMEINIVTSAGASGGFDADGTPTVYRRAMEYLRDGLIDAESLLSHRYTELADLQRAFQEDSLSDDFIKGVWVNNPVQ